ncbi:MAG TPA: amidase [Acidimicrobiaceae bacterium]|nr:amidase [Acidimicrobiaceae bacterium]
MLSAEEYNRHDAVGLAALVATGEVTAAEVLQESMARIEATERPLNGVVATCFDDAHRNVGALLPTGPLTGVPYLVKDLNTWVRGMPATNGSRALANFVPDRDAVLIERLRTAGLILLGKTNTPEFGLNVCTAPALFGVTPNPFDPTRSAGGSSGGSAVAVATGVVPAAHATDSGGSIRIPASNCGLFGLKPSRSRVPLGNDQPEGLGGLSAGHAVTHSVRDSAVLLDATTGPLPGRVNEFRESAGPFIDALVRDMPDLRVALWTDGLAGEAVSEECARVAAEAAILCESVGCLVEEVRPPVEGGALRHALDVVFTTNIRQVVQAVLADQPAAVTEGLLEPITVACFEAGARHDGVAYEAALRHAQRVAHAMEEFFERFDLLLTPTLAEPPMPLGQLDMQTDDWDSYFQHLLDAIPFTPLFNVTGGPAASVPLGWSGDGLPIGVQFGAAVGSETTVLRLARELEQAKPWHDRI